MWRSIVCAFSVGMALSACAHSESPPPPPFSHVNGLLSMATRQDDSETERLLRAAADAGDARALADLGVQIGPDRPGPSESAEVLQQKLAASVALFRIAADKGDAVGQMNLGAVCVQRPGWAQQAGACKDMSEAVEWFRRAAAQGYLRATVYLGFMAELGLGGLPQDASEAIRLYRSAADQGEPLGARFLAEMDQREHMRRNGRAKP